MFEGEEEEAQEQDVAPLRAALEEAAAAAEAQGRSKQPGQASFSLAPVHCFSSLFFLCCYLVPCHVNQPASVFCVDIFFK